MNKTVLAELRQALGDECVSTAPEDLAAYAYDGTWAEHAAGCRCPSAGDRAGGGGAAHCGCGARAGGAARLHDGLAGGAVPVEGSICLNMTRMNRILEISVPDTVAVVQPGVITQDLQRAAEQLGFFYPPDGQRLQRRSAAMWRPTRRPALLEVRRHRRLRAGTGGRAGGRTRAAAGRAHDQGRGRGLISSGSSSGRRARWALPPRSRCG